MADEPVAYDENLARAFYLDIKGGADPVKLRPQLLQASTIAALDAAVARIEAEK